MVSAELRRLAADNSAIRAMFEEGNNLAIKYGRENVYDFSLGNPNFAPPEAVKKAIIDVLDTEDSMFVHGYMSNTGYADVRKAVAENLNSRFGTDFGVDNIIMTVGAAGGLNVMFKTLLDPGDEVIAFSPFFVEYGNYVRNFCGVLKIVPTDPETFQIDPEELAAAVTERTRAVIINNPNNPTGVIYTEQALAGLAAALERRSAEIGHPIYVLSDEPYRELAYDGKKVPWLTKIYRNTIVSYSWSKSLSLPGERIGYLAIPSEIDDFEEVSTAASISNRVLGFVNAPSLMQRVVMRCLNESTDIGAYARNRALLYTELSRLGFECVRPEGAFYMWVKSPEPNEKAFVAKAKEELILFVPGSSFAWPGYVRIAYCVSPDMIKRSLPAFERLAARYGLQKKETV